MKRRTFFQAASMAGVSAWFAQPSRVAAFGNVDSPGDIDLLIDADTANEIDDLYAIVRALLEPRFNVLGLSSAQWNHRLSPPDTVLQSQKLNEQILASMGRVDIPSPLGAEMIMGQPWGGDEPRDSPAAQLIITTARSMADGRKLTVACLGAVTNLASAIKIAPDIVPRIACHMLSGRFFEDRNVWDKDEFNLRNDLNAANYLFNTEGLALHVMPVNILLSFQLRRDTVMQRMAGKGGIWDVLATRWLTHSPSSEAWIMWDLALIIALARSELATQGLFMTPPENRQREVYVYTAVDDIAMQEDWWDVVATAQQG